MKRKYDAPEFEQIKIAIQENLLNASAEGDPGGFIGEGGDDPID